MVDFLLVEEGVLGASASGRRSVRGGLDGGTPTFPGRGRQPSRASPGEPLGASASGRRFLGVDGGDADLPRERTPTFPGEAWEPLGASASGRRFWVWTAGRRPSQGEDADLPRVGPGNHWERRPLAVGLWEGDWTAGRRPSQGGDTDLPGARTLTLPDRLPGVFRIRCC
jgi:hypothetical protein